MIGQMLGFNMPGVVSAMLLPFPDPLGGFMDHIRMKVFPPVVTTKTNRKGEETTSTVKYLQPKATGSRLYFARAVMGRVCDGEETLHLVEGEKKVFVFSQAGYPAVAFSGVENWHAAGTTELLPDFDLIRLKGRRVRVYPDGDVRTNENVWHAIEKLGDALSARGALPELVHIPEEVAR